MKQTLFTLLSTLFFMGTYAQEPEFEWAKAMGGTNREEGNSIVIDDSGNVYTTGRFHGTVDFDPDPFTSFNLTSVGGYDIFISKLDANGNFLWAKSMGGTRDEEGRSIAIDGSGNVYTTGYFRNTADFDPGQDTFNLTSAGFWDIFISKLDANGNFLWAKSIGDIGDDEGYSIAIDDNSNVYTTGYFSYTADFDPGQDTFNLTSIWGNDIFISKLDANGNFVWAKSMGGTSTDSGYSIAIGDNDNIYTTGSFGGTTDFDPGIDTFNLTTIGGDDIFISKLDTNGSFLWAKAMGSTSNDKGHSIAIDGSGNIYTTGYFEGTTDFDPGVGTYNLSSAGDRDIFISKLDANGDFIWAKAMGGTSRDEGNSIAIDDSGNVYTTGYFLGTADFDPGSDTFIISSVGYDIFISKLDVNGNFLWIKSMGGAQYDYGNSITIDNRGAVYTTGHFRGTADFDPGSDTFNLTSGLFHDIFVHKMSQCISRARGEVFWDVNENCIKDAGETTLTHTLLISIQPGDYTVQTAANGRWEIDSLPTGNYTATIDTSNANWLTCPPTQSFTVVHPDSCTLVPDFGFVAKYPCPAPNISIAMPQIRRGFSDQEIYVQACNLNSATDSLTSAYALLELDSNISVQNASLVYTNLGNNIFEVQLGDLLPGECVNFYFNVTVELSAQALQTLCLEAELFPQSECVFDSTETPYIIDTTFTPCTLPWDKSSISIEAWCDQDSVYFIISNTGDIGSGDMDCYSPMRFYIDGILVKFDSVMLQGQETTTLAYAGTGETFSIEVDQHPLHPGHSRPNAHIENCGNGTWTPGIIPQMPTDDIDPVVDVFCGQVTAPLDPNDKRGFPLGVGEQKIIRANQNLEYMIRFQNVGTDTAVNIVIKDTLSEDFNIFTLQSGVSSHPYEFSISGQRELTWRFNNIMLPDSTIDQPNSNGFVMFKVEQNPDLPLGTVLKNRAGIYFDFEAPVITNTSAHTISEFNLLPIGIDEILLCDSSEYTWIDGNTYYTNNTSATYTLPGAAASGIDSIVRLRLSFNTSTSGTDSIIACDSLIWIDENTYYANNNTATHTLQNEQGCDSIITLNLTVYSSSTESYIETICEGDVYAVHGFTYDQTGIYNDTLFYQSGCDSIRYTVNLTVDSATELTYTETICEGDVFSVHGFDYDQSGVYKDTLFYQSGCDSIRFTVDLTVDSATAENFTDTICGGDVYSVHGYDYNQTGVYYDTLNYQSGCDSIVFTVDLTVKEADIENYTGTICEGDVYVVQGFDYNQTGVYKDTLFYLSGCDSISFTVDLTVNPVDSTFETRVTCTPSDTGVFVFSETNRYTCDSVHTLSVSLDNCIGIKAKSLFDFVSIFPNPAKDVLIVQIKTPLLSGDVSGGIYSLEGKLLQSLRLKEGTNSLDVSNYATGLYFLQLISKEEQKVFKVVLEP
ncbi:MAG: SBBP repeat-containing protein [Chitinophagales bacterium]